jgi:hypothetical protein
MRWFLLGFLLLAACEDQRASSDPVLTSARRHELCDRMCQHFEDCALDRAACMTDCEARPLTHVRDAALADFTECAEMERCSDLPGSLVVDCEAAIPGQAYHQAFAAACAQKAATCGAGAVCPLVTPWDETVTDAATTCLDGTCEALSACLTAAVPGW